MNDKERLDGIVDCLGNEDPAENRQVIGCLRGHEANEQQIVISVHPGHICRLATPPIASPGQARPSRVVLGGMRTEP
jgi:hypothetical protein